MTIFAVVVCFDPDVVIFDWSLCVLCHTIGSDFSGFRSPAKFDVANPHHFTMPRKGVKRKASSRSRASSSEEESPNFNDAIAEAPEFEAEAIRGFRVVAQQRQYLYLRSRFCCY